MNKKRIKGLSILEIVFAFAILELGLLAIIGSFPVISRMNRNAWDISVATELASEKMEEIHQGKYNDSVETAGKNTPIKDSPDELFACTRSIWFEKDPEDEDGSTINNDVWSASVRVEWMEDDMKRNVELRSYIYLYNQDAKKGEGPGGPPADADGSGNITPSPIQDDDITGGEILDPDDASGT